MYVVFLSTISSSIRYQEGHIDEAPPMQLPVYCTFYALNSQCINNLSSLDKGVDDRDGVWISILI